MLKDYLHIAWQNLVNIKYISLLNVSGLSVGIVTFVLIMLEVSCKLNYDKLFKNTADIYLFYRVYLSKEHHELNNIRICDLSQPLWENEQPDNINFVTLEQSYLGENIISEVLMGRIVDSFFLKVIDHKMVNWIECFAYKTELSYWIAVSVGLLTVLIGLVRRKLQSSKSAMRNPVEALRYE